MPYNKKTDNYEIDYDAFSRLNAASDIVLKYLFYYILYKNRYTYYPNNIAQLRAILKGEDCSRNAKAFLCQCVEGKDLLPEDFDILSDEISGHDRRYLKDIEIHTGECILGDLRFTFEYEIETDRYNTLSRRFTKVILEGDDFIVKDLDLIKACRSYHELKKEAIEEENRKKSFRIISDRVKESYKLIYGTVEYHVGECMYGDLKFKFEYESIDAPSYAQTPNYKCKKVVLEGYDFVAESQESIYEACKTYFERKAIFDERERLKREQKEEEDRWVKFRYKHLQEIKDWLSPILETKDCIFCQRVRWMLSSGFIDYKTLTEVERGYCNGCTGRCRFPGLVPDGKEHSDKWYELGIDKLDLKLLLSYPFYELDKRENELNRPKKQYY